MFYGIITFTLNKSYAIVSNVLTQAVRNSCMIDILYFKSVPMVDMAGHVPFSVETV